MPATLDIADPPEAVRTVQAQLDQALDEKLPAKLPGGNIIVGTWNVRAFAGLTEDWETAREQSPKCNFDDLVHIAAFIRRCDVVAVQEVRGNLRGLRHLMDALGQDWAFILTDVNRQPGGNDERLAFLFDTTRVKPSGLACELVGWMESGAAQYARREQCRGGAGQHAAERAPAPRPPPTPARQFLRAPVARAAQLGLASCRTCHWPLRDVTVAFQACTTCRTCQGQLCPRRLAPSA